MRKGIKLFSLLFAAFTVIFVSVLILFYVVFPYCAQNSQSGEAFSGNTDGIFQQTQSMFKDKAVETGETKVHNTQGRSEDERILCAVESSDASFLNEREYALYKIVCRFKSENDGKSDYEIVKAAYDLVCESARYDDIISESLDFYVYDSASSYGALCDGLTVCAGYAKAVKLLCNACQIECLYISGDTNSAHHAWNLVNVDGEWYHLDATWDDGEQHGYDYFLVTDAYMKVSRCWSESYPRAESYKYELGLYRQVDSYNDAMNYVIENFGEGGMSCISSTSAIDDFDFIFDYYEVDGLVIRGLVGNGRLMYQIVSCDNAL